MNYFETIKCDDYEIFNLDYHEKRIANTIGKNIYLRDYIYPPNNQLLKCKVIYNEDEILDIEFAHYSKKEIHSLKLVYDDTINYKYKYENREQLNQHLVREKKENNIDEIIIVKDNLITDTTIANIAILLDNQNDFKHENSKQWYTPKKPLLYGTTRARYLEMNKIKELDITVDMLKKAKKLAFLNAMIDFDILDDYEILV